MSGHENREHSTMGNRSHLVRRIVAGGMVLAALAAGPLALVGTAAAAAAPTPTTGTPSAVAHTDAKPGSGRKLSVCSGGKGRFKLGRMGTGFTKRAVRLEARAAKAKAAGHTKLASYLTRLAAIDGANASRLHKHYVKAEGRLAAYRSAVCSH
jgi:hypothetical protein